MPESQLRLLVACGAAGGIAATFNAPIAGVFFALELILRNFETRSFGLVVLSSVTADAIGRAAFGSHPFLALPAFSFSSPVELVLYAGLGVLAAGVGLGFVRVLYGGEDLADRLWRGPDWLRPAAGGLLLGLLLLAVPEMYGVGYPVLEHAVAGHYVIAGAARPAGSEDPRDEPDDVDRRLGRRLRARRSSWAPCSAAPTARSRTTHSRTSPRPPAPTGWSAWAPCSRPPPRAPITAVLIIFELTGDYRVILPLMIAVVVATALAGAVTGDTIYTLKLRRRGVDIDAPPPSRFAQITVGEASGELPAPLRPQQPLREIVDRFAAERINALPVIGDDGRLLGVVSAVDVESALTRTGAGPAELDAQALVHEAPELRVDESLEEALWRLGATDDDGLVVLDERGERPVGWLTHRSLLAAYRARSGEPTPSPRAPNRGAGPRQAPTAPRTSSRVRGG